MAAIIKRVVPLAKSQGCFHLRSDEGNVSDEYVTLLFILQRNSLRHIRCSILYVNLSIEGVIIDILYREFYIRKKRQNSAVSSVILSIERFARGANREIEHFATR